MEGIIGGDIRRLGGGDVEKGRLVVGFPIISVGGVVLPRQPISASLAILGTTQLASQHTSCSI